jgi:hypothetical protein
MVRARLPHLTLNFDARPMSGEERERARRVLEDALARL